MRAIKNNHIPFGGVLLLLTMDHTQLAPVQAKPILVSSHILSCFKMVRLEYSVRFNSNLNFQRVQEIARMLPSQYENDPSLLTEFKSQASQTFTFVSN